MAVIVTLSTTLRRHAPGYVPEQGIVLDLPEPVSAGALAERLGLPLGEIKIIMLNGRHADLQQPVRDGDRVAYFPAVGGG